MASGGSALYQQATSIKSNVKRLINNDLKEICRREGLQVSGVKAALQTRIITRLDAYVTSGDYEGITRIRNRVNNHGHTPEPTTSSMTYAAPSTPMPTYGSSNGYARPGYANDGSAKQSLYRTRFSFKDSPFYEVVEPLMDAFELPVVPSNRTSATGNLTLNSEVVDRIRNTSNLRLMLYCASDPVLVTYTKADVAFPAQMELRINGDEIKANFKGLKNRVGSTRPVDITDYVRKTPNYRNSIVFTYALTQKVIKFHAVVNLVRKHTVEELTERVKKGSVISKTKVLSEMISKANDPDIVATSTVMSLKDPVSTLRIKLPCRSTVCSHNQCFDAESFLQLQEQAPTWQCPVCNKTVAFEGLVVDQYVQDILAVVPRSTEQVTIEPDGKWSQGNNIEDSSRNNGTNGAHDGDDDSDDLIEISNSRITNLKTEDTNTPFSFARTPPLSSREPSTSGSAPTPALSRSGGAKRTSEVVDLTLDDDDEPPPPAKKVAYNIPHSIPDPPLNGFRPPSLPPNPRSRPNGISPFRLTSPREGTVEYGTPPALQPTLQARADQRYYSPTRFSDFRPR